MLHNQAELYRCMDEQNLDYVIGTMSQNVIYLTDFFSPNQSWLAGTVTLVIYPRDEHKQPILVLSKSEAELLTSAPGWVKEFRCYGDAFIEDVGHARLSEMDALLRDYLKTPGFPNPVEAALDAFKALKLAPGERIGIDEKGVSAPFINALSAALQRELPFSSAVIGQARLIKTPEEVKRLKKAVEITEQAVHACLARAEIGMTELALQQIYSEELCKRGALPAMTCIGFGAHGAHANAQATDYIKLERNQAIRFDIGCRYKYYQADTAKIAVKGELPPQQLRYFEALKQGIALGIEKIKPGFPSSTVFSTVMDFVRGTIPHYRRSHVGHGIGIELYDPPTIGAADWCFREGMVMCVEAPYYELGVGGLQVEEVVYVGKDGAELLSERPVEIIGVS